MPPGSVQLLDSNTVNQIAAGEVVERPASVVKELVENALDAGATRIEIDLVDSGKTLIRVSDNGTGMNGPDAELALQRHATSKIRSTEDLEHVLSLGFRGEALPSIASVSRLTLSTAEQDGLRSVVKVSGGEVGALEAQSGPRGTEVRVEDLFFNTPARLKFLKSDTTEVGQAMDHVSRYAMAYPHVAFTMRHNGQTALQTSGAGDQQAAAADIWGRDLARVLATINLEIGGMHLTGFVSPPHVTKPTRAFQYVYVNGRPVRTRTLTAAIDQSFRDITPDRRFPLLVLMINIDPARVDVNVSPTKSEVKFQQEGQAFEAIRMALKGALMEHGMMPNAAAVASVNDALADIEASRKQVAAAKWYKGAPSTPDQRPVFGAGWLQPEAPLLPSFVPDRPVSQSAGPMPFVHLIDGLRVIGQAMKTFIIAETHHGLVVIDQHVAHERILYEYLCGIKGSTLIEKQSLLVPQTLNLDRRSAVLIQDRLDEIRAVGFDLDAFGGESFVVRAVPAAIKGKDPLKILRDMIDELVESSVTRRLVPTREQIWITSSCKMAVKAGDTLSITEMERLIQDLAYTENPYLCPHGRPITVTLSADALLRMFKRT